MPPEVQKSFDNAGMQATAERFHHGVENVGGIRKQLDQEMEVLARAWGGEASRKFQQVMHSWRLEHNKVVQELGAIAIALGDSAKMVEAAEQEAETDTGFFTEDTASASPSNPHPATAA